MLSLRQHLYFETMSLLQYIVVPILTLYSVHRLAVQISPGEQAELETFETLGPKLVGTERRVHRHRRSPLEQQLLMNHD